MNNDTAKIGSQTKYASITVNSDNFDLTDAKLYFGVISKTNQDYAIRIGLHKKIIDVVHRNSTGSWVTDYTWNG